MKIIFVCMGNVTRSPACEMVLRQMLADRGIDNITVESAGLVDIEGSERDHWMIEAGMDRGYIISGKSRKLTPEIAAGADMIIYMEHCHLVCLEQIVPYKKWKNMYLFNDLCFGEDTDLEDPSWDTHKARWDCLDRIEEGCKRLVEILSKHKNYETDEEN